MADNYWAQCPLRRVVDVLGADDNRIPWEVYECGHGGWMSGAKPAKRRRCPACVAHLRPTPPICPECFHARRWEDLGGGCRDAVCDHCGRRGAWDA